MNLQKPMDQILKAGNFPLLWLCLTLNTETMIILKELNLLLGNDWVFLSLAL